MHTVDMVQAPSTVGQIELRKSSMISALSSPLIVTQGSAIDHMDYVNVVYMIYDSAMICL